MSEQATEPLKAKDYKGRLPPVWCPGCGDFGVLAATQRALAEKQLAPEDVVFISGIGCSSRFPHFMNAYGFHSCHGRSLPVAIGAKLAQPERTVLAVGGDGDGLAIGVGHFVHACRRNPNITYVMMDNEVYGLTKGQASPTSELGLKTKTTPFTSPETSADQPLNPLALAVLSGATFVARGYSGSMKQLVGLVTQALDHEGFSFVQVISPCVTFNDIFEKARAENSVLEVKHDLKDRPAALMAALGAPFVTGVFFEDSRQTLDHALEAACKEAAKKMDKGLSAVANQIWANAGVDRPSFKATE
jgi:2-oxoglutarate ferredoxin oxidoreductase subunit beta